jgi:hypothetical protein
MMAKLPSLRGANGSRECAPDDSLRDEAIHASALLRCVWIASLSLSSGGALRRPVGSQ